MHSKCIGIEIQKKKYMVKLIINIKYAKLMAY